MDAEIADAAFEQELADGVGHGADADLQTGAVADLARDVARDGAVDVAWRRVGQLQRRRRVALDHVVDFADMDPGALAVDIRQAGRGLDDDHLGALDHRAVPEIGDAQVEEPVRVDRAGLEDDDVHGRDEPPVIVGDLAQVHRKIMAGAGVVLLPVVAAEVQAQEIDVLGLGIGFEHGPGLHRKAAADLEIGDFADAMGERAVEGVRLPKDRAVVEPHARLDETGGALGRYCLRRGRRGSYVHARSP